MPRIAARPFTKADWHPTTWRVRLRCQRRGETFEYVVSVDGCHPDERRQLAHEAARQLAAADTGRPAHSFSLVASQRTE